MVIVVCGATASGKTSLAIEYAKKLNGEVISADSLLVYRQLNIGTAKPTMEERQGIVHHMIDVVSPTENFSVSDYEKMALPILEDIQKRGKTPIICGGTGFYIKSLLFEQKFGCAAADPTIREKYEEILQEKGKEYLHSLLEKCDKESADVLHCNDTKRVIRALEIFDLTGRKKSEQKDEEIPRFDYKAIALDWKRETLYNRIDKRVEIMFSQGLVEEVSSLIKQGITIENQCMQGIGYKEVYDGLKNGQSEKQIKELIQKNTRNYAKRQLTFFKRLPNLEWIAKED